MEFINVRSDTQTLPSRAMREAIMNAPLGDDTYDEDPTVTEFERMAAEIVGKEAAVLVLSGTMGNLTSLMAHCTPGDEVLLDLESHIFYYEAGGMANIAGLMPMPIPTDRGMMSPEDVVSRIRKPDLHLPTPRLFCLENTHNRSGGRVVPLALHNDLCHAAHERGLAVHLDGARIFNAAIAEKVPVVEFTKNVDSIQVCLTKGLGCPLGSFVAGSREFIARVDRARKRVGGGMRQAGVIAAAGIYALTHNIERQVDDHRRARKLAELINEIPGLSVDPQGVETNMIYFSHTATGLGTPEMIRKLREAGVLASGRPPRDIRMCTHLDIDDEAVEEVARRVRRAMQREKATA